MRLLLGIVLGVIAGMLVAPGSGRDSRKKIADETDRFKHRAEDRLNELLEQGKSFYEQMVRDLRGSDNKASKAAAKKAAQVGGTSPAGE